MSKNNCGICMDEFTNSMKPIQFNNWIKNTDCKCNIEYHKHCLLKWKKYKMYIQCPMCRFTIHNKSNNYGEDFIDIYITYIKNLIDDYIYKYIEDISTYNTYCQILLIFIFITISFAFTIFILLPYFIIKYIVKKYHQFG